MAVGAVSAAIVVIFGRTHLANIAMLYLLAVLLIAASFGSGPAIVASVAAFLAFDFLFTEPYYTFTVADPAEWVALVVFLVTAVITGQLAAEQRRRAQEAKQREREAVVLYDVARLMSESDLRSAIVAVAERLRAELGLLGVAVELMDMPGVPGLIVAGDARLMGGLGGAPSSPSALLHEGSAPTARHAAGTGRWIAVVPPRTPWKRTRETRSSQFVVPVNVGNRRAGTIALVREPGGQQVGGTESRLLSAIATHLGQALERDRLRRASIDGEVLRRSNELKTSLLHAVSHDLRTPLASVLASAGSLRQEDVTWTADDRREFVDTIEHEAARLNAIIGNLLDLSRMEAGILDPEKGWYDLGALVDDVVGRLRPVTSRHHVEVHVPEDLPPVELDYVEIDQVLSNLVENAAKYAPQGTEILIAARHAPGEIELEVSDRGPGIATDALPRLFDAFYRGRQTRARDKGSGLGLAVAKGLVEAHGGRIHAENRSGGGARFLFTLPLTAAPPPVTEPASDR